MPRRELCDCSRDLLGILSVSDRSQYGAVLILIVKEILCKIFARRSFYPELAQGRRDLATETSCRDLVRRALLEILCRENAKRSLTEILPKKLFCRELVRRSLEEILPGDLLQGARKEILPRHLLQGFLESHCRDLLSEFLPRELFGEPVQKSLKQILPKDLFQAGRPLTDLVQRVAQRSVEILPRGPLQRSCQESSYRQLLQKSHKEILPSDLL